MLFLSAVGTDITTAVLLAAGRGKRLGALTADMPKPMLDIAGAPLISHIVDALASGGLRDFIDRGWLLGPEQIEEWAKTYRRENPGIDITTVRQPELNGTGGAMLAAQAHLVVRGALRLRMGRHPDGPRKLSALHASRAQSTTTI